MREVVIFRNNLFRVSEPFITDQASLLRRYQPLYMGRFRYGPAPHGAESLALGDSGAFAGNTAAVLQMLSRSPAPYLRALQGRRPPVLMHAHFGVDGVHALPLARRLGVPLVTTFHGFDATLSTAALLTSAAWFNYPLFRGELARHGALFLCVSSFIRDRVLAQGFPPARTHVHYTGVDCARISPRAPDEEAPIILHVARLVEMKGTEYLLRAFAMLAPRHRHTRLVVVGDGALMGKLRSLAASLDVAARVDFLGARPHDEALARMRRAAMLVLPSVHTRTGRVEGLGMVMLEAAATGVPVVASRVGGIPEGVAHGETGLLVPERDPEALAQAMTRLLDAPDLRLRMGTAARMFVERKFDAVPLGARLEDFYDRVVDHLAERALAEGGRADA